MRTLLVVRYYDVSRLFCDCIVSFFLLRDQMGGACGTYGGRERCAQGFGGET